MLLAARGKREMNAVGLLRILIVKRILTSQKRQRVKEKCVFRDVTMTFSRLGLARVPTSSETLSF